MKNLNGLIISVGKCSSGQSGKKQRRGVLPVFGSSKVCRIDYNFRFWELQGLQSQYCTCLVKTFLIQGTGIVKQPKPHSKRITKRVQSLLGNLGQRKRFPPLLPINPIKPIPGQVGQFSSLSTWSVRKSNPLDGALFFRHLSNRALLSPTLEVLFVLLLYRKLKSSLTSLRGLSQKTICCSTCVKTWRDSWTSVALGSCLWFTKRHWKKSILSIDRSRQDFYSRCLVLCQTDLVPGRVAYETWCDDSCPRDPERVRSDHVHVVRPMLLASEQKKRWQSCIFFGSSSPHLLVCWQVVHAELEEKGSRTLWPLMSEQHQKKFCTNEFLGLT